MRDFITAVQVPGQRVRIDEHQSVFFGTTGSINTVIGLFYLSQLNSFSSQSFAEGVRGEKSRKVMV